MPGQRLPSGSWFQSTQMSTASRFQSSGSSLCSAPWADSGAFSWFRGSVSATHHSGLKWRALYQGHVPPGAEECSPSLEAFCARKTENLSGLPAKTGCTLSILDLITSLRSIWGWNFLFHWNNFFPSYQINSLPSPNSPNNIYFVLASGLSFLLHLWSYCSKRNLKIHTWN